MLSLLWNFRRLYNFLTHNKLNRTVYKLDNGIWSCSFGDTRDNIEHIGRDKPLKGMPGGCHSSLWQ